MKELKCFRKTRSFLTAKPFFARVVLVCVATASAFAQEGSSYVFHPNQEVRVTGLPSLTAPSTEASAVLATALATILHDKAVCCGKDSALGDTALAASLSLKELSASLQGRHVLSDGRSVMVSAEYVPQGSITPDLMISALLDQHALLIEWRSHFYVLYAAIFDETVYSSGQRQFVVHKLLLLDPRFSDQRRETEFRRESDDWGKVQGLLTLTAARQ